MYLSGFSGITAYAAILGILLASGLGVPLPEDITLIAAGILAALNSVSFIGALIVGFIGVLLGDCMLFFLGRKFGYRVFRLPLFRSIFTERRIQLSRQKVLSNSKFICFSARFLPGLRAAIFLTAGIMGVRPIIFITLDGIAALISVPIWIYFGWFFGSNLDHALHIAMRAQKYTIISVLLILILYAWFKRRASRREKELLKHVEPPPIASEK